MKRMRKSRNQSILSVDFIPITVLELEAAKEILAEVFRIGISEVDEMIRNRFEEVHPQEEEGGLWPQEFCLEG